MAEPQAATLARDLWHGLALILGTTASQVLVPLTEDPVAVVEQVAVLLAAGGADAHLVVFLAVLAVLVAKRLAAIDALARGRGATRALAEQATTLVGAGRVRQENEGAPSLGSPAA